MKNVLTVAAVTEEATGVALLILPSLVLHLLLGADLTGVAIMVTRLTGIALIGLGVACWPGTPLAGMLTYNVLATLYLACAGLTGFVGILLWPVVAFHGGLSILLARAWWIGQRRPETRT